MTTALQLEKANRIEILESYKQTGEGGPLFAHSSSQYTRMRMSKAVIRQ